MIINLIKSNGKATVRIVNGYRNTNLTLQGIADGSAVYVVPTDENGEGSVEMYPGNYYAFFPGTMTDNYKIVRIFSGYNVLDMSK